MVLTRKLGTALSLVRFWIEASPNGADQTPEALANLVFKYRGVAPIQVRSELLAFASLIQERRPKALLEIGTCNGGTFFVLCRLADPHATVISLDLPGGRFGGGYGGYRVPVLRRMKRPQQRLHLLRADSHNPSTLGRVTSLLQGTRLDLLFIDADHAYEGVRQDFEMYSPLMKPGGIVAFHDIISGRVELVGGVEQFWNEIKTRYRYSEIIESPRQPWGGIGVLYL
jgi:predicted O-methyltransferase YrrM